jgi:exopolysaccharide production protein ExoZ
MRYRNIQGLRAIAALLVVSVHTFQYIAPMRTHGAKSFFLAMLWRSSSMPSGDV